MPERQVFVNGRHEYVWLGKGGAFPRHGNGPISGAVSGTIGAARLGHLQPQTAVGSRKENGR